MQVRLTETTPLSEAGPITSSGRMAVQAISAGVGTSGYYSPAVLEQAAKDRLITRGTPVHLDHPTETERHDRPERSVQTIAGVFTGDASYDADRQALIGEVQFFTPFRERIAEMAPYVGLSITGSATNVKEGEHGGRKVPVIEGLAVIDSVDVVTRAGRGGKLLLNESARPEAALVDHINGAYGQALTEAGLIITADTPNVSVTRPDSSTPTTTKTPEVIMGNIQIDEAAHRDLVERAGRVETLESERNSALSERDTAIQERDAVRRQLAEATARDGAISRARARLAEAANLPTLTVDRIVAEAVRDFRLTESGVLDEQAFDTVFDAARQREETYLAGIAEAAGAGRVIGNGAAAPVGDGTVTREHTKAAIAEAFNHTKTTSGQEG